MMDNYIVITADGECDSVDIPTTEEDSDIDVHNND